MAKPDLLKWVSGDEAAKITDPGASKKLAGFLYKEKPPFQHMNWFFNQIYKWFRGLQGNYYDVVIGSAAQVTALEATHTIADLNDALAPPETKILILSGVHTLTANIALTSNYIEIYCENNSAIVELSSLYKLTLSGAAVRGDIRFSNATATPAFELTGISSLVKTHSLSASSVVISASSTVISSQGIISPAINASTGTFTGAVSALTGTFSTSLKTPLITAEVLNDDLHINNNGTGKVFINGIQQGFRGCLVYNSTDIVLLSAVGKILTFDSERYDTDNIHDDVTNNSRLTVPTGVSKVRFKSNATIQANATGIRLLTIKKNGSSLLYDGYGKNSKDAISTGDTNIQCFTGVCEVIAGDYFEVEAYQNSGIPLNAELQQTWLSMEIIE